MTDVIIRAAEPSDLEALTEMANLPGVRHGTMRVPFTPQAVMEQRVAARPGVHVLVAAIDKRAIGQGILTQHNGRRSHAGEVYLFVHDDHVGKGIGTNLLRALLDLADNWVGLRRVELTVNVDNERAVRLYERMGFEREGTRRADILRDGKLVDCFLMARVKEAPELHNISGD